MIMATHLNPIFQIDHAQLETTRHLVDVDNVQQTLTVVLEPLLVLHVLQGQVPVPDFQGATLVQPGSTGQGLVMGAERVLPTPIRYIKDLPRALVAPQVPNTPALEQEAAAHAPLVHPGSTGQDLVMDAELALPTPIRDIQDLPRALVAPQVPDTPVLEQEAAAHAPLVHPGSTGQVQGLDAGPVHLTTTQIARDRRLVLAVLLGPSQVPERPAATLAQPDSTGQVLGLDALPVLPTTSLVLELLVALAVLLERFLVLDPLH